MMSVRRSELAELSVHELIGRLVHAEWQCDQLRADNVRLQLLLSRAQCGSLAGPTTSCQLPRGHDGLHAHDDNGLVIRWG